MTINIRLLMCLMLFCVYAVMDADDTSIISEIKANHEDSAHEVSLLSDGNDNTYFYTGPSNGWNEAAYLEIDVKSDMLKENDSENCIVVTVKRHNTGLDDAHPTGFRVEGQFEGSDEWVPLFYTYFLYRGGLTSEFSERIPVANLWKSVEVSEDNKMTATSDPRREGKALVKMRFTVLSTNNNRKQEASGGNSFHVMALNAFDVLMLPVSSQLPGGFSNRFHLATDYLTDLKDFRFENTKGILDPHNAVDGWWIERTDVDALLASGDGIDISMPEYDLIESNSSKYPLDSDQKRQPAHTVEHILYAIPGDVVNLYPYYELYKTPKFQINYSHWYDYKTGGRIRFEPEWSNGGYDLLDFLADPSNIQATDNYGFFGGPHLNVKTYVVNSVKDWTDLVAKVNVDQSKDTPQYFNIELGADLDFAGKDSVAMMGNSTTHPFNGRLNGNGHTIKNLKISYPKDGSVGLIRFSADGAIIENLNIDSSCTITGSYRVGGVVGEHRGGALTFRNIHSEATVVGKSSGSEQTAAGLLGFCNTVPNKNSNVLRIEDCYVGGKVGDPTTNHGGSYNAALIAWWEVNNNEAPVVLKNVIVDCDLTGYESSNKFKRYIRHRHNTNAIVENGNIKTKSIFSFENCYGNVDQDDECWNPVDHRLQALINAGWADVETPPMIDNLEIDVDEYPAENRFYAGTVTEYIDAVDKINLLSGSDIYFELTNNIDFGNRTDIPMLGQESSKPFSGFFNGNGHVISNLVQKKNYACVGIVRYAGAGIRLENIILDSTCHFEGTQYSALVGEHLGGKMTVRNYKTEATFIGTSTSAEQCAAAILGINKADINSNEIHISDVYIGGSIGNQEKWPSNPNNAALIGWFENRKFETQPESEITRVIVRCKLYHTDASKKKFIRHRQSDKSITENGITGSYEKANFIFSDCFGSPSIDTNDGCWMQLSDRVQLCDYPTLEGWKNNVTPDVKESSNLEKLQNNIGERAPGTSATFLYPWCPYLEKTEQTELSFPEGDDEYVIAADFSQRFDIGKNMDKDGKVLYEPVISVRHIFRIRDGKTFAESLSGSVKNNKDYLRKNLKIVSARGNVPFQIRLTTPVPTEKNVNGRSNYYYKLDENRYSHICGMDIRVLDGETRSVITNPGFRFSEEFTGLGTRVIDSIAYSTGDGDNMFYRMLSLQNPAPNTHYIVQLIGKDDAGNRATIFGSEEPLVVMEYDLTFLPERGASMITEETLYNDDRFKHARIEYLDETYGGTNRQPSTFIDFDDYIRINNLQGNDDLKSKFVQTASTTANGMQHSYFKWPLDWSLSEYSFGYNDRQDYNMYMLATHSSVVPYKDAAGAFDKNVEGDGTGLYDRLYYRTKRMNETGTYALQKMQQGYFYYVNASTDPGVTARLNINQLCQGSTIHVSAWISEFSKAAETANLSFNFVAVLRDDIETNHKDLGLGNGERIVLHQFVTGYVSDDSRGQWLNVYYSFVPRLSDFASSTLNSSMVDHYEIELDNNCKNSAGADYAIDDIRAYVVPPTIEAKQLAPMCSDKQLRIRVASPFDTLLELAGETEAAVSDAAQLVSLYYTFVDKEEYDSRIFDVTDDTEYSKILQETLVRPMPDRDYNHIQFWSNYSKNTPYAYTDNYVATDYAYRLRDQETGERYIVFENLVDESINAGLLNAGKEYYLVLNTGYGDFTPEKNLSEFFNLRNECASKCVMVITPSSIVKVNGIVETQKGRLVICENTSPTIQANVLGYNQTGDAIDIKKNAVFDWFFGTIDEFKAYKDGEGRTLEEALQVFRTKYPDAVNLDGISADAAKTRGSEQLEQWMLDIIDRAMTDIGSRGVALLTLHQRTFVMPPVEMPDDEEVEIFFTAIPIPISEEDIPENVIVCSDPTELSVTVGFKAPTMRHGLSKITYPNALTDVPLRIGLEQIREEGNMKTIEVPVYRAESTDENVNELVRNKEKRKVGDTEVEKEGCIILLQSDDPDYSDLGALDEEEDGTGDFPWVGEVTKLQASTAEGAKNYFLMQLRDDFNVKEGYYYKLRFEYMESLIDEDKSDAVCNGQELITLKIVPKFQLWTGQENLNWNNDANWSRLDAAEICSAKADGEHKDFVTDGSNSRSKSYAPLDFTYVVVKDGSESPYLYGAGAETEVKDDYDKSYDWPEDPSPKATASTDYSDYPADSPGQATEWIQYDMAATTLPTPEENVDVRCRPWYMNTCNEIHFKPGGTLMNQQELVYKKAWVDMELDHSRWQTLSTPLKEVYAGDFYLPSDGARQKTELFQDIFFDNTLAANHRFKPAVYQRGWDKGTAKVYDLEVQTFDSPRNVAVKTSWSHVYNDVTEQYGEGNGFSVKTDVSGMTTNKPAAGDKVLFRLPKADTEYLYFTQDGQHSGHRTPIAREADKYHRLNDTHGEITAVSSDECSYFLVGNPFMTHMDIQTFISSNPDLEPVFWIITSEGQVAGTIDGETVTVADPADNAGQYDPTVVAPMQGFFVKTKTPAKEVKLTYDEKMMRRYDSRQGKENNYLTSTTRVGEGTGVLRIVAECDGIPSTAALLSTDTLGVARFDIEAVDNRSLDIPATVYTVKEGRALSINHAADAEGTEIGVIADDDTETLLRFSGVDATEGMYLLDKADRSLTPLEEGLEVPVKGAAAGRYFLTYGIADEGVMSGIEWKVEGGVLTAVDNAASGFMEVNVFDTLGRLIKHASTAEDVIDVPLESGIFVVTVRTAKESLSAKVRI